MIFRIASRWSFFEDLSFFLFFFLFLLCIVRKSFEREEEKQRSLYLYLSTILGYSFFLSFFLRSPALQDFRPNPGSRTRVTLTYI